MNQGKVIRGDGEIVSRGGTGPLSCTMTATTTEVSLRTGSPGGRRAVRDAMFVTTQATSSVMAAAERCHKENKACP